MRKCVLTNDDISSEAINDNVNEKELSNKECDDSISHCVGSEEFFLMILKIRMNQLKMQSNADQINLAEKVYLVVLQNTPYPLYHMR